jgi:hypothetical protein
MAALTVFRAGAFVTGAKFAAVVFTLLGHAFAVLDLAIAFGMSTWFLGHDYTSCGDNSLKRHLSCHRRNRTGEPMYPYPAENPYRERLGVSFFQDKR